RIARLIGEDPMALLGEVPQPAATSANLLRTRAGWAETVAAARRRYATVPSEFFERVGNLGGSGLPDRVDVQLVGEFARALHDAEHRSDEQATEVTARLGAEVEHRRARVNDQEPKRRAR